VARKNKVRELTRDEIEYTSPDKKEKEAQSYKERQKKLTFPVREGK